MSTHPLSEDLTALSSDDLEKRYTELMKRYHIARRMNMPQNVIHQLDIMLDGIEYEKTRRYNTIDPNESTVVLNTDSNTTKTNN